MHQLAGDAPGGQGKAGEDQHLTARDRDIPLGGQPLQHSPRGAENDRGIAAQKNLQTFPFNGRVKAADDAAPGVAPLGGLIVGAENGIAGTGGRAEQGGLGQGEQVVVAARGQFGQGVRPQTLPQTGEIWRRNRLD